MIKKELKLTKKILYFRYQNINYKFWCHHKNGGIKTYNTKL